MMIKVIASGLIFGSDTYFHTGWNVMDGALVIISIIDLGTMNRGAMVTPNNESDATTRIFSMLRVFRLLRTLRPLRGKMDSSFISSHSPSTCSDQPRTGIEVGRPNPTLLAETHRSYRGHLLHILHYLRYSRRSGSSCSPCRSPICRRHLFTVVQRKVLLLWRSLCSQYHHATTMWRRARTSLEKSTVQLR